MIIFVLVNYYGGWDGQSDIPKWVCILSGVLYHAYHVRNIR